MSASSLRDVERDTTSLLSRKDGLYDPDENGCLGHVRDMILTTIAAACMCTCIAMIVAPIVIATRESHPDFSDLKSVAISFAILGSLSGCLGYAIKVICCRCPVIEGIDV